MQILPRRPPRLALSPLHSSSSSFSFPIPIPIPLTSSSFVCTSCRRRSLRQFSASSSRAAAPPQPQAQAPPPPSGYALLSSRRLISVAGPDAPKFLHGLITQSVVDEPATSAGGRHRHNAAATPRTATGAAAPGFYAAFLNATGRVLHDVFVYRDTLGFGSNGGAGVGVGEGEAFVIEVDADQVDNLAKHIRRYKLRSKLAFRVLDPGECAAWQVWDDSRAQQQTPEYPLLTHLKDDSIVLPDTRAPGMGFRVLRRGKGGGGGGEGAGSESGLVLPLDLPRADDAAYRVRRYLRGVPEGQAEIQREQALPLEANMDVMGGVDFRKGCYVGQELTIRTRHRGVVRKRVLPCLLYPDTTTTTTSSSGEGQGPPDKLEYRPYVTEGRGADQGLSAEDVPAYLSIGRDGARGRSAGTWLRGVGNIGLALCRLQIMTDVELPGETAAGAPFDPQRDEFVVKWGVDEEGAGGVDGGDGAGKGRRLKIKAFVPDWLRERLRENS